jgi:hypothetical protein
MEKRHGQYSGQPTILRRMEMKLRKTLCVTIGAVGFLVLAGSVATAKDSRNIVLGHDVTIGGSHLASGEYSVLWETHSPAATVSFLRKGKVVATAEGKVVDRGTRYRANEIVYNEAGNGARMIQEIRFRGSSEVIVFNE